MLALDSNASPEFMKSIVRGGIVRLGFICDAGARWRPNERRAIFAAPRSKSKEGQIQMVTAVDFRAELEAQISRAQKQGRPHVEINAGELHRVVGGYPGSAIHSMPVCCDVMRKRAREMSSDPIFEPPSGKGASLTIRYRFENVEGS